MQVKLPDDDEPDNMAIMISDFTDDGLPNVHDDAGCREIKGFCISKQRTRSSNRENRNAGQAYPCVIAVGTTIAESENIMESENPTPMCPANCMCCSVLRPESELDSEPEPESESEFKLDKALVKLTLINSEIEDKLEFSTLQLDKQLIGSGRFGKIYRAVKQGAQSDQDEQLGIKVLAFKINAENVKTSYGPYGTILNLDEKFKGIDGENIGAQLLKRIARGERIEESKIELLIKHSMKSKQFFPGTTIVLPGPLVYAVAVHVFVLEDTMESLESLATKNSAKMTVVQATQLKSSFNQYIAALEKNSIFHNDLFPRNVMITRPANQASASVSECDTSWPVESVIDFRLIDWGSASATLDVPPQDKIEGAIDTLTTTCV